MSVYKYGFYALVFLLQGCVSGVWSGANFIYDRHNVYKKISDYSLGQHTTKILFADKVLKQKGCGLDVAIFNQDILIAGHVPNRKLYDTAMRRISYLNNYRHLYKVIRISDEDTSLDDTWITTKVRSQIIADSEVDPNIFKVITVDSTVYLMGDVPKKQAQRVIAIARETDGVLKVIKLLHYYTLSD